MSGSSNVSIIYGASEKEKDNTLAHISWSTYNTQSFTSGDNNRYVYAQ